MSKFFIHRPVFAGVIAIIIVLAGLVAAMRARGLEPFEAACAGVWLHGRAAELAGPGMIADDLAAAIPDALTRCT